MQDYVLITPARNEENYIEKTIKSVISQTVLPKKWVIVSDGSTDRTDEIVKRYEAEYDFIQLLRIERHSSRNFGSKVYAIRAGIEQLKGTEYDFIGNLDADVSFEPDYYKHILRKFEENHRLGITGGILFGVCGGKWIQQRTSTSWSVSGPIQMFRRQCYEDIGGYMPLQKGGIDAIAEVMARMHGWQVRSFPELKVYHHRRTGTENQSVYSARIRLGMQDYSVGSTPIFEFARCMYRIIEKPYIVGAALILWGYFVAFLRRDEIVTSDDFRKYIRKEQIARLKGIFRIPCWKSLHKRYN